MNEQGASNPMHSNIKATISISSTPGVVLIAASIAAFIGACWATQYLLSTSYGGTLFSTPLINYIMGQAYDLDGKGSDALLVVVSRFMLASACLWMPLTAVLAFARTLLLTMRQPLADTIQAPDTDATLGTSSR